MNNADRLLLIFTKAKSSQIQNMKAIVSWANVFGIINGVVPILETDQETETLRRLIELHKLIIETERQITSIEGLDLELYLSPFPRIKDACRTMYLLNETIGQSMHQISESDLTILRFCSKELDKYFSEPNVDDEMLIELSQRIDELFNEVSNASLPKELKLFLLRNLEAMRRAIQEFRIRGNERLREGLEAIVGSLLVNQDVVKESANIAEMSKFKKVFQRFVSIIKFADQARPLISPAASILGLLMPTDPNSIPPIELPPSE